MKTLTHLLFILIYTQIISCTGNSNYRQLRKKVIVHYKAEKNPQKLKAATFLLDNIEDKFAIEGERYNAYCDTIKIYHQNFWMLHKKLKPLNDCSYSSSQVLDMETLTSDYLNDNIDRAFSSYEKTKWKDEIDFNDFCEYILPYRIGNEPLENWRELIENDSVFILTGDTINSFNDMEAAAFYFTKAHSRLKKDFMLKWGSDGLSIPDLQYSVLDLLSTGSCSNLTQISMFACRSAGFPVANDFTPFWANATNGHDWAALITKSGTVPYILPVDTGLYNYKGLDRIPSKVYRKIFSTNSQSHLTKRGYCAFLPSVFNNSHVIDVTDLYMKTFTLNIPELVKQNKNKFTYLAVSNRYGWMPVAWGQGKKGLANFTKVCEKVVYLPVFMQNAEPQAFNYPFIVSGEGQIHYLKPEKDKPRIVELYRKQPMSLLIKSYIDRMIGGRFQAANNAEFKNALTLYTVNESPGAYYNEVLINNPNKYRYVRYLGRDSSNCYIAEIEFYTKNNEQVLTGEVIGTKGWRSLNSVFDGDVLTYYAASLEPDRWVGLDLGKAVDISKIRFSARNDKNHIIEGDLYELFYWDNEWQSLGQQAGVDKVLVYENVPSNSLLLLRNYTEGKEERIFTYENGKQVWW